jgi:hypothetical protein
MWVVGRILRLVSDLPIIIQPRLQMSAATEVMIAAGLAYQLGGVVRHPGNGRQRDHLQQHRSWRAQAPECRPEAW